ncbi:unnamed protein product [Mytilus coruscus]|uniref:Uncharacterized protein n=1 Tax=Mytilus coruscus TaxID=42192 RepID=A0A6J8CRF7_MYTCO|nr:unnamed protein product [Mytilus coruscus]
MNVIISSVSGEKISDNKCRKKLARKLGLPVSRGHAIRTRILKSEKSSWTYTNRKTRSDAITPDTKKRIYEFWCSLCISTELHGKMNNFKILLEISQKSNVCVHDFSENYRCSELTEIQSAYFQKTEVSVHVTILHRHALLEYDGVDSSEDFPEIITEQFFVISPDLVHDQYFVHKVRNYIAEYLQSISYSVDTMHEFTDGCAAQYKSRHCFGDISQTSDDFGYQHFTRNFFETSHAKGPQDAAGGIIKRQADCAILRGQTQIWTAKDLYEYVNSFLTQPRSHSVPSIRSLHQVRASRDSAKGLINISELSCFCVNCCHHMYDQCSNSIKTGGYTEWEMKREYRADAQENEENEEVSLQELVSVGRLVALYTDDDEEEYYMLKVEKSMETLRIDTTDSWGSLLPAGTPVFRGLFYNKTNSPFQYRLVNRKAVVPAASVDKTSVKKCISTLF